MTDKPMTADEALEICAVDNDYAASVVAEELQHLRAEVTAWKTAALTVVGQSSVDGGPYFGFSAMEWARFAHTALNEIRKKTALECAEICASYAKSFKSPSRLDTAELCEAAILARFGLAPPSAT